MKKLCHYISEYMGVLVLVAALLAMAFPSVLQQIPTTVINYLLGVVMFGMGLTLNLRDFKIVFSRPKDVIVGCMAQFTIMPLLAWALARLFALDEALALGVVLVGCCPGGTASNVITYLAKGDLALSVGMTGVSTLLAPLLTPLLTWALAGKNVDVDVAGMMLSILWVVILPIVVGLTVKAFWPKFTEKAVDYLPAVSSLAIAFIVAVVIGANANKLMAGGLLIVVVVILHNVCGLSLGYLIARLLRLSEPKKRAVSIEVGMQNSGLASSLATLHFDTAYPMATIPGAIFSVWHNISGAIVARLYSRTIRKAFFLLLPCVILTNISCTNVRQTTYSGHIVDVIQQRIYDGEITVEDGIISNVRECTLPGGNDYPYIMPGFIDSHVHIESSMILPQEFAKAAVRHGTIGCMSDPHEIGNVLGTDGVRYMIEQGKRVPFNILWGAPSCVPSMGGDVETSGAVIDSKGVAELMAMNEIGYLSEMMDYVGVLNRAPEVMAKIKAAHDAGKLVDGHAPGLMGEQRREYAQTGITTDHECSNTEEGRQCIEAGMKLLIREGSAAKNYLALCQLIDEYPDEVMFCTDDYNPEELLQGHINLIVKRALADGYDFWNVMKAASLNPQRHYGQNWGLLQKGDPATFIMTDSITPGFHVLKTILKGNVAFDGQENVEEPVLPSQFVASPITVADIALDPQGAEVHHVIVATDGSLLTGHEILHSAGSAQVQELSEDIQKIVVYNRYQKGCKPSVGLIRGFHLTHGAMASSVAHDCHNIVAIGSSDEAIVRAINRVIEMKGGQVAIADDKMADLPLPIAGLMSPLPVEQVAQQSIALHEVVREAGCNMSAPFITMAFMCLPVIPELKITDKYLWDGTDMKPVINYK